MYFNNQEIKSITFILTDKNNYRYTHIFYYASKNGLNLEFKITSKNLEDIKYWFSTM